MSVAVKVTYTAPVLLLMLLLHLQLHLQPTDARALHQSECEGKYPFIHFTLHCKTYNVSVEKKFIHGYCYTIMPGSNDEISIMRIDNFYECYRVTKNKWNFPQYHQLEPKEVPASLFGKCEYYRPNCTDYLVQYNSKTKEKCQYTTDNYPCHEEPRELQEQHGDVNVSVTVIQMYVTARNIAGDSCWWVLLNSTHNNYTYVRNDIDKSCHNCDARGHCKLPQKPQGAHKDCMYTLGIDCKWRQVCKFHESWPCNEEARAEGKQDAAGEKYQNQSTVKGLL